MPTLLRAAPPPSTRARTIDESRWPLVIVTFVGDATDEEYQAFLGQRTALLSRRETHATIVDGRRCGSMPPSQRKLQADWQRDHADLGRQYNLGLAFLSTSPVIRGILTALLWMQPFSSPHTVVSTWAEAELWAAARLRSADLDAPPASATQAR